MLVEVGGRTLFHPGDALDAQVPVEVDILCVPVSAPWCAVKETIAFVRRIEPTAIVPIHDALLTPTARAMYLAHVGDFGVDGGVEERDLADAGPQQF